MATQKFQFLPASVALSDADVIPSTQDISTTAIDRKVTGTQLKAFISDQGLFTTDSVMFTDRISLDTNVYIDDDSLVADNVIFAFDAFDFLGYDKSTNRFYVQMGGAPTPEFQILQSGALQCDQGFDRVSAGALSIAPTTATSIILNQSTTIPSGETLSVNTINETTAANGVGIDGVILKDTTVEADVLTTNQLGVKSPATGITVTATDGFLMPNPDGGGSTEFNHYEVLTTFAPRMLPNVGTSTWDWTTTVVRVGEIVTLIVEEDTSPIITGLSPDTFTGTGATAIPSRLRPLYEICQPLIVLQSGSILNTPGSICMGTDGILELRKVFDTNSQWTVLGTAGIRGFSMSWSVA